jgi:WD40 repeat protein
MFPLPPRPLSPDPTKARVEFDFKHASPLVGVRFDPSGRFLFASAQDNAVLRFDLLTGEKATLAGHESWVRGMAFVGGGGADEVAAWEKKRAALPAVAGFGAVAFPKPKPHPFALVSGDYGGKLIWWPGDADAPKPLRTVAAHDGWVRAVAVSADGKMVASCGNDGLVKLWTPDGAPLRTLQGHTSHVYNVAFHPDGKRLASCDLKGVVKDWDIPSGVVAREFDAKALYKYDPGFMADIGGARGMAFDAGSPAQPVPPEEERAKRGARTGTRLAVAGITNVSNAFAGVGNPLVVVFDWADGKAKQLKPKDAFQGTMWGVAFHPGGFVMAAGGGNGGRVWFWRGDEVTSFHVVTVPPNARDLTLSPTGARFAVAGANGSALVYTFTPGPPPVSAKK